MKKKSTTLTLSLKRKWFDLIKSGVKLEEYREYNGYWGVRFLVREPGLKDCIHVRMDYTDLVFTLGYPKKDDLSRRLVFKNPRIQIRTGKPEWGAEPGKTYFVITWDAPESGRILDKYDDENPECD